MIEVMPISPWVGIVLVLAAVRLTRFFVKDTLMGFGETNTGRFASGLAVRLDRFAYTPPTIDDSGRVLDEGGDDRSFIRGKIGDLFTCTFCLGWWISAAVYFGYLGATIGWDGITDISWTIHGIAVFAIAGAQSYINSRPGY
jgi:hypothetical protein